MSNKYAKDTGTDSREPFINTNHVHNTSGPSNSDNGSNNRNNFPNSSNGINNSNSNQKQTKAQFEYAQMERTIGRLKTYLFAMFGVCIAGFIILIVVVTVLFASLNSDLVHHKHTPKVGEIMASILDREELCLPCSQIKLGPTREEKRLLELFTLRQDDQGEHQCCVNTPLELVQLMKMFVERRFREEIAKGTIPQFTRDSSLTTTREQKPAAHLMMTPPMGLESKNSRGRLYMIEQWVHDKDLAFLYHTAYRQGRLVVPEDGYYFVYSQVSFIVPRVDSRSDDSILHHYLYRMNLNYKSEKELLAKSSMTACQSRSEGDHVSHLGAVFLLRNSDEVFIKVSNISMVNTDAKMSHFGLFQV